VTSRTGLGLFYFNHIGSSGKLHNKAQVAAEAQPRQEKPR
jgi:hypothetical protein